MFKRQIIYSMYPPFDALLDGDLSIIQRYVSMRFYVFENEPAIVFIVEQICERNGENFISTVEQFPFKSTDIPPNLHPTVFALYKDEIIGKTAEMYAQSIFHDLIVLNLTQHVWVEQYFPKWYEELKLQTKDNVLEKLLKIQRSINDDRFIENQTIRDLY